MTQLYRHYDANGLLLYVGISLSAVKRLGEHKNSCWFDQIARIEIENHPSRDAALNAEREAITLENPIYNMQHNRRKFRSKFTSVVGGNVEYEIFGADMRFYRHLERDKFMRDDITAQIIEVWQAFRSDDSRMFASPFAGQLLDMPLPQMVAGKIDRIIYLHHMEFSQDR